MPPHPLLHRSRRMLLIVSLSCWVAAFLATHTPTERLPSRLPGDVTMHLVGYLALSSVVLLTLIAYGLSRPRRIIAILIIMAAYAAFDEITQPLVQRYAAWQDWMADMGGTLAAVILVELAFSLLAHIRRQGSDT